MMPVDPMFDQFRARLASIQCGESPFYFDPDLFNCMRKAVVCPEAVTSRALLSHSVFTIFLSRHKIWAPLFDPTTKRDDVLRGRLGTCLSVDCWSDAMLNPESQFVPKDHVYVASFTPDNVIHRIVGHLVC